MCRLDYGAAQRCVSPPAGHRPAPGTARATAGREEGLPQSPPQCPRFVYSGGVVPKPRCFIVPFAFCLRLLRLPSVPQNKAFWGPGPGKTHLRTPITAILGSRSQENALPCPKTGHFGVPSPEKRRFVPQNRAFWVPGLGEIAPPLGKTGVFAHPRQGKSALMGKTGVFAHPRQGKQRSVGQNRRFCPSAAGKTALRWAKQAFLPIHGRENAAPLGKTGVFAHPRRGNKRWRILESGGKGEAGIRNR